MKQIIYTSVMAAVVASVVVFLGITLVGNQSASEPASQPLGAAISSNRLPNSGLTARCLNVSTSSPQTVCTDGQVSQTAGRAFFASLISGDSDSTLPGFTTSTPGTVSAATVCNSSVIDIAIPAATGTISDLSLPSSTALQADCFTLVGQTKTVFFQNTSSSGSFTFTTTGPSSTIKTISAFASSSPTVNGTTTLEFTDFARVEVLRATSGSQPWMFFLIDVMR